MSHFWLGVLAATVAWWALTTITLVAIRGAERHTPMAAGHWPMDDAEDDIDRELRTITRDAA